MKFESLSEEERNEFGGRFGGPLLLAGVVALFAFSSSREQPDSTGTTTNISISPEFETASSPVEFTDPDNPLHNSAAFSPALNN